MPTMGARGGHGGLTPYRIRNARAAIAARGK
jgi:hypothetical protein